jgi:peptide/nickel transport system permease protein
VFQSFLVLVGVVFITIILFHLVPATTLAKAILGPRATPSQIQGVIAQRGFNKPVWIQLWWQFYNYAHLNFGNSFHYNEPVRTLIAQKLPNTLALVGISTILALIVAVPLGVFQTVRRNKPSDYVLSSLAFIFYAMPPFVLGPLLILFLAVDIHIFNPVIDPSQSVWSIITNLKEFTLPVVSLAAVTVASFSRYMRSSMMDALAEDYVRTAKAKGAGRGRVLFRHAFRNALIPIITLIGLSLPAIAGGAVITETVFNYPGMGLATFIGASSFDVNVVISTTVVATVLTVAGSLIADLLYAVVDPRIRYARR